MAKPAQNNKPAANTTTAVATEAAFDWADDLPAGGRRGGGGFSASADLKALGDLPAPQPKEGGGFRFARKWFPAPEAPANITVEAERNQFVKDELRKMVNKYSGMTRRITKKDGSKVYKVAQVENGGKPGVGVYRVTHVTPPAA